MNPETEAQLRHEANRGMRASDLLNDDLMIEAFATITERLSSEWANSPVRDTEGRERIWMMQKLLQSLKGHIEEVLQTGKMAALQLEQQRTIAQRLKSQMSEWL